MLIIDFKPEHIEQAINIAKSNYEEEREYVKALPKVDVLPDLKGFADNGLGVAAFEDGKMLGYLCCYKPWGNHFGKTLGTFSPIHAHGTLTENRNRIYSYLYHAAAKKWISKEISSHAIALYAHDSEALDSFFWNGFGLRCLDAIRPMKKLSIKSNSNFSLTELKTDERIKILNLRNLLISHTIESPIFIPNYPYSEENFADILKKRNSRIFATKNGTDILAYIEIMDDGENFACDDKSMMNICGACCLPEYRGTGLYHELLSYMTNILIAEGYARLGVDFESFNPTARGFWLKYFTPYTKSVVRRIDERILDIKQM